MNVKLSNREIKIDLYQITITDYEKLFLDSVKDEEKRAIQCKTFGISVDEFSALPMPDGLMLQKAFWDACREPLKDPNSESVPTSV